MKYPPARFSVGLKDKDTDREIVERLKKRLEELDDNSWIRQELLKILGEKNENI